MKQYEKVNSSKATHLKVEVYYNKGGYSYFSCQTEKRGFYASISPVIITDYGNGLQSESYTAFSGYNQLVTEAKRYSEKAEKEAVEKAKEIIERMKEKVLIDIR